MAKRILEGFWDCNYCGKKGIGGLTKNCPACGRPQGDGVKFYLKNDEKNYLDSETANEYAKGADWQCDYCGSYNRYYQKKCTNCNSEKKDSKTDYFGNSINPENNHSTKSDFYEENNKNTSTLTEKENDSSENKLKNAFDFFCIGLFIIGFIFLLVSFFAPKNYTAVVSSNYWERSILIDEHKWIPDNSWSYVPSGARNVTSNYEIYEYEKVIDHYKTVKVKKSREVFDHTEYKEYTSYSDNGDGTFSEITKKVPHDIYKTEYYYETEEEPIYKSIPIFKNHYYYEIQKWVYKRTEKLSKSNDYSPCWPKYSLAPNERISLKEEKYIIVFKTKKKEYKKKVPKNYLNKYKLGDKVKITVKLNFVTKINGKKIK